MNALAIAVLIVLLAIVLRVIADNGLKGFGAWVTAKFGGVTGGQPASGAAGALQGGALGTGPQGALGGLVGGVIGRGGP